MTKFLDKELIAGIYRENLNDLNNCLSKLRQMKDEVESKERLDLAESFVQGIKRRINEL